ncbi:MAG: flagellar basal-body rod protein FlgG [Rhodospirillales bacterium]|nr:flagellar basal-body rod protein FlgG [Rhodospirillales bacterium]
MEALRIAASGMMAQQYNTEVVANNLANMNTTGYQRRRAEFSDLIYKVSERKPSISSRAGRAVPGGIESGKGVRMGSIYRVSEQGSLTATSNNFDLAIQGGGYFQILLPNGDTGYTRDGAFQLNATGQLVTNDGFPVQPGIIIPAGAIDVTINASGEVLVTEKSGEEPTNIGTIQIATFPNEGGLEAMGDNLFRATRTSGPATVDNPAQAAYGSLMQGYLESSNVDPISEIAALIAAQRAYEMNSKVVQAADQMMGPAR